MADKKFLRTVMVMALFVFVPLLSSCGTAGNSIVSEESGGGDEQSEGETSETLTLSNVQLTAGVDSISLSWTNPTGASFSSVLVVRSSDDFPETVDDGTTICEGDIESCEDDTASASLDTVYYSLFIENTVGTVARDTTKSGYSLGIISTKSGLTNYAQAATFYDSKLYFAYEGNMYRIPYDTSTQSLGSEQTLATRSYDIIDMDPVSATVWRLADQSSGQIRQVTFEDSNMTSVQSDSIQAVALGTSLFGVVAGGGNIYAVDGAAATGDADGELLQYGDEYNILWPDGDHAYRGIDYYDESIFIGNAYTDANSVFVFNNTSDAFSEIGQSALSANSVTPRKIEVDENYLYVIGQHSSGPLLIFEHDGTFVRAIPITGTTIDIATNDDDVVFVFTTDSKVHVVRVR